MRHLMLSATLLLTLAMLPAGAQTTPPAGADSTSAAATAPDAGSLPVTFIQAAMQALAAGHLTAAQEATEQAESRALDRSVKPSEAGTPSTQPLVQQLRQARQALGAGDRKQAMALLQQAASNPDASK